MLFIGDKQWSVNGDKQRQIINIMCNHCKLDPASKMRWNSILSETNQESIRIGELFKGSAVKEAIGIKCQLQ